MVAAGDDIKFILLNLVNKSVGIVNSATPIAMKVILQRFGFS